VKKIERAGAGDVESLRLKARSAPLNVKRSLDRERRASGLPPLWSFRELLPEKRPSGLFFAIRPVASPKSTPRPPAIKGM
jgi:hypothetical protein